MCATGLSISQYVLAAGLYMAAIAAGGGLAACCACFLGAAKLPLLENARAAILVPAEVRQVDRTDEVQKAGAFRLQPC